MLRIVSDNYFVQKSDPMMMGVGGTKYMTFELSKDATEKGECVIPFLYNQPWGEFPPDWQMTPQSKIRL